ncbi:hypothetical protein OV208_24820 [Corallococcus sp. bb12-1]|uniref:hypothetical protein n=1 Tax=Corallococcus sp. bb12-1 TaxID=2996784 RepID=UPI00226D9B7A|nr:hypothetical protein [Corallococcus sp. bb12-1]MCY1044563.1 hypothetical protein [Corallococcus sp. bb12-1]
MSTTTNGIMAILSPAADKMSLVVAVGLKGAAEILNQIAWQPLWHAFAVNAAMNIAPSGTICNGTVYVVYPSILNDTSNAFCYTCTGTTWSSSGQLDGVLTNCGMGAVTYNNVPYAFYQGTTLNMKNSGQLFVKQLPSGSYWNVLGDQVIMSNIPTAVEFNGEVYVFYQGPGNDEQIWFTHSSNISSGNWAASTQVPDVGLPASASPGAMIFNNQAYIFYQSSNDNTMYYRGMNTAGTWGTEVHIPNVSMSGIPSPLVYDGVLYVFYQGSDGGSSWYLNSNDAVNWSEPVQLGITGGSASPSLVVYDSQLCCLTQGPGNDSQLWSCLITPGQTNSFMAQINNEIMSWSPGAAVYNGQVFVFLQGEGESGAMYCCIGDSNGWQPSIQIVGETGMTGSPAPVVYNDVLYVFSQGGAYTGNLRYNTYSPSSGWSAQQGVVPNAGMSGWPGPVVWNNQLYVFYEGMGNANGVWYSVMSSNGSWSGSTQMNTSTVTYSNQTGSNHAGTNAPCGVVFNDILYVGYLANGGELYINEFSTDSSVCHPNNILGTTTASCAFSMAVLDGVLYLVYQNGTTGKLWYTTNSGNPCDGGQWSPPIQLGAAPSSAPAAFTGWVENTISCRQMF